MFPAYMIKLLKTLMFFLFLMVVFFHLVNLMTYDHSSGLSLKHFEGNKEIDIKPTQTVYDNIPNLTDACKDLPDVPVVVDYDKKLNITDVKKNLPGMYNIEKVDIRDTNILDTKLYDLSIAKQQVKDDNVTKVLIFAIFRGGSSFASDFFRKVRHSFLTFEPLVFLNTTSTLNVDNDKKLKLLKPKDTVGLLMLIFNCKFREVYTICLYYHTENMCRHWSALSFGHRQSLTLADLESRCLKASLRTIKIVRALHLDLVAPLVDYGVKIIHLVRDPRGILSSRVKLLFQRTPFNKTIANMTYWMHHVLKTKVLCAELSHNLHFTARIMNSQSSRPNLASATTVSQWPSHYFLVRYEDLARNPTNQAEILYKFLGSNVPKDITMWIARSTRIIVPEKLQRSIMSTLRQNWTETALSWKTEFWIRTVSYIQKVCTEPIQLLGYKNITSETGLHSNQNNVLSELDLAKIIKYYKDIDMTTFTRKIN